MMTKLQMLDAGAGLALSAWIFYWIYRMCSRAHALRRQKRQANQGLRAWRGDRTGKGRLR